MMEAPTCASVEGVLRVASVVGSLFKSPCTYTGFSEAMVRPQLMALHVPMLTLILAPSRTFSARRKKIGGFSRSSWALALPQYLGALAEHSGGHQFRCGCRGPWRNLFAGDELSSTQKLT